MSFDELLIIVIGLFFGYWVVTLFSFGSKNKKKGSKVNTNKNKN